MGGLLRDTAAGKMGLFGKSSKDVKKNLNKDLATSRAKNEVLKKTNASFASNALNTASLLNANKEEERASSLL